MIRFLQSDQEREELRLLLERFHTAHRAQHGHNHSLAAYGCYTERVTRYAPHNARILEIGSGDAKAAMSLASLGYEVTAVDFYSDARLEELYEEASDLNIRFIGGGFSLGTFEKGPWDVICARNVFEHLLNLEEVLDAICSVT